MIGLQYYLSDKPLLKSGIMRHWRSGNCSLNGWYALQCAHHHKFAYLLLELAFPGAASACDCNCAVLGGRGRGVLLLAYGMNTKTASQTCTSKQAS